MTRVFARKRVYGSALMEYALPMACIVVAAGLLGTMVDINGLVRQYFLAASGHDSSFVSGKSFKPTTLSGDASGSTGNGSGGFDNLGSLKDASGGTISVGGPGLVYSGADSRGGRTQTVGGNGDQLYANQGQGELYDLAIKLQQSGAPEEYVSRVLSGAMITESLSAAKNKGMGNLDNVSAQTVALRAQLAGTTAYANSHMNEVLKYGGLAGQNVWSTAMGTSIRNSDQIAENFAMMYDGLGGDFNEKVRSLMSDGAAKDKLSAALQACSVGGGGCTSEMAELKNQAQALLSLAGTSNMTVDQMMASIINAKNFDGEQQLVAKDKTSGYVAENYQLFTGPMAEKDFKAGLPTESAPAP